MLETNMGVEGGVVATSQGIMLA